MIVKWPSDSHFTVWLGPGSHSDRVILPGRDHTRVKVTRFFGDTGDQWPSIKHNVDETIFMVYGYLQVKFGGAVHDLTPGCILHVPAGEEYAAKVLLPCCAACMFSQAADGTLPVDDPVPFDVD